jgi:hypothetical protein
VQANLRNNLFVVSSKKKAALLQHTAAAKRSQTARAEQKNHL